MALKCGIVGLPNVGKSTIFNALTAAGVAAESYPFCTIEPNTGVVPVPDPRLPVIHSIMKSPRAVPTTVEFVDIAGLVRGASRGEGLGNQFLGHIRETDAIVHVVRCFEDENVAHVEGDPEPVRDIETVETELGLADIETVERRLDRARRSTANSGDRRAREEIGFLEDLRAHVSEGGTARGFEVPEALDPVFRDCHLLSAKPVLFVANLDEESLRGGSSHDRALEAHAREAGATVVRICGELEAEISELSDDEKLEFLGDLELEEPGLNRLIRAAYALLDLITFFSATEKEVRAWTLRRGLPALKAAGVIHSDFETHFIRAEVIPFEEYRDAGGETGARARGSLQIEGKDYVVQDGDVIYFRTSA
jgi:GTP-binding protein YchF